MDRCGAVGGGRLCRISGNLRGEGRLRARLVFRRRGVPAAGWRPRLRAGLRGSASECCAARPCRMPARNSDGPRPLEPSVLQTVAPNARLRMPARLHAAERPLQTLPRLLSEERRTPPAARQHCERGRPRGGLFIDGDLRPAGAVDPFASGRPRAAQTGATSAAAARRETCRAPRSQRSQACTRLQRTAANRRCNGWRKAPPRARRQARPPRRP